ncbi:MAG TPA: hypothetical protein VJ842_07415 [Pyrinomonadaceae bacterium]|nr:hypothetical protein [Pyrinomonadaceae bacterium]
MASEESLVRALDLMTIAPQAELEGLSTAARSHTKNIRRVVDTKNVVAVGISEKISQGKPTGTIALTFYVERKLPLSKMKASVAVPPAVPESISGPAVIPTDVVAVGKPRPEAVKDLKNPLAVRKPLQPGFSIGTVEGSGTFGAVVTRDGKFLILSNSHVLANSGLGKKGDRIIYPGGADKGKAPQDIVAKLFDFVKFKVGNDFLNRVDCAVALPLDDRLGELTSEIKGLFIPKGTTKAARDMEVVKVGRTTGKTKGIVKDVNFRFIMSYPGVGTVGFLDQIFCTRYTNNGDSGSLVIDTQTGKAVGLHFAGFPDKNGVKGSVCNPIDEVLKALEVKLLTKAVKIK